MKQFFSIEIMHRFNSIMIIMLIVISFLRHKNVHSVNQPKYELNKHLLG